MPTAVKNKKEEGTEGGGNAPISWMPTAVKKKKEGEEDHSIPQGSVISPVLFNVMINDIFMNLDRRVGSALYADDGAIWVRGRDSIGVIHKIKEAIKKLEQWSHNWGFKLSSSKSCHMLFTRKKGIDKQYLEFSGGC